MKHKIKLVWRATRPFAFPASVTPVLLGTAAAWFLSGHAIYWSRFILSILGVMLLHSGANMFNDYYDFRKGVDRRGTLGSSGILTEDLMPQQKLFRLALGFYAVGSVIGVILWQQAGPGVLWLGVAGVVAGYIYTGGPALKYHLLGDLTVFFIFGVLITTGAYYVQTGHLSWTPALYSIPLGLLIDSILHGNNIRDIPGDRAVEIKTLAGALGEKSATYFYLFLVGGAFLSIPFLVFGDHLPWTCFLVLLTLPVAVRNIRMVFHFKKVPAEKFALIDAMSAQLAMIFGLLMTVGILVGKWI